MHAFSPHALAAALGARGRVAGLAAAVGVAGAAMLVVPALAQAGNQPPVAVDDAYAIVQNTATPLTVLGNDTDADGDTLSVQSVSAPAHGAIALSGGTLTYTPTTGYTGNDTFTYVVSDGHGNTDTGSVNLYIAATIGIPNAVDDSVTVPMNTATSLTVLANDTDPDGQTLTVTAVSTPAHGTAVIVGGTTITYTPTSGYTGADSFSYTVNDGFGSTDLATVTVNVTSTGDAPVAQNDAANVPMNAATILTVLANDTDPNGDTLTVSAVGTPTHGTATITGGATTVTYTPTAGYSGVDSFSYTVSDGHGHTASAMVAIVVAAPQTLLVRNDSTSTRADTAKTIAVLNNDVPANSANTLTVTSVTAPAHGTAVITSDAKKVTYTPAAGYTGTDTFMYTATETGGSSATATVTVTVRPKPTTGDDDDDEDTPGKDECKDGRWIDLGFRNQGLCIAEANHGFMHNGQPLFPHGLFPNGLFPNGLFPNGVFGDHHDDDDDRDGVQRRNDDDHGRKGLGAQIRETVRASINAGHGKQHGRD